MCRSCPTWHAVRVHLATHHFKVVEDGRHLLNPLDDLHRSVGVFRLPRHLLVQGHLPAHGRVVHLPTTQGHTELSDVQGDGLLSQIRGEGFVVSTFPCRWRLCCRNSLTSSSVSLWKVKRLINYCLPKMVWEEKLLWNVFLSKSGEHDRRASK